MCTVTWLRRPGDEGYELFFNRDEQRTRGAAMPPEVGLCNGVRFVAPTDSDAGGTWIGVNEHGVTVGVLNGAGSAERSALESRGRLVRSLLDCDAPERVESRLAEADLARFRPFRLFALGPGALAPSVLVWDGRVLEIVRDGAPPLVSSSLDAARALEERRAAYRAIVLASGSPDSRLPDSGRLAAFHRSHLPERGPFSVCMHRPDASTVSSTRVSVGRERVRLEYHGGPPCDAGPAVERSIERRTTGSRT